MNIWFDVFGIHLGHNLRTPVHLTVTVIVKQQLLQTHHIQLNILCWVQVTAIFSYHQQNHFRNTKILMLNTYAKYT